jgi:hypothetical protein
MPIKAVLPGYPVYLGSKKIVVVDFKGPTNYQAAVHETIQAAQFGQGGIDLIKMLNAAVTVNTVTGGGGGTLPIEVFGVSFSGTYFVTATLFVATSPDDAVPSIVLRWYTLATGVEVVGPTDLSAETVRALIIFV